MLFRYLIDTIGLPEKKVFMIPLWNFIDSGNYFHMRYRYREKSEGKGKGELQLIQQGKCRRISLTTVLPIAAVATTDSKAKIRTTTCDLKPKTCQPTSTACPQSEIVFFAQKFDLVEETSNKESKQKIIDPKNVCLKFHKNIQGKVSCFSGGQWFGGYLSHLLSSTSIVILFGFLQPFHETHHVDMLLYHGLVVVSTHSLDLSLDRAYGDVVSFADSPSEIIEIVNRLQSNRTELTRRATEGKKFIQQKVRCLLFPILITPPPFLLSLLFRWLPQRIFVSL
jgi:hypothetical protein